MTYVSTRAPIWYDPITALDDAARAEMAKSKQRPVGTEIVNGIPAVIMEADSQDGKVRTWIAQNGDFPVKMALQAKSEALTTMMEVKQMDFKPPSASLFVPPGNCGNQVQGEWSDTSLSAHAGAQIDVQASASADLATVRVFYATARAEAIIVFHAFQKKSQKTPAREIELARRRLGEVLNEKIEI
jgi:hypothetical protein